ncbi:UDP-glucose 6-dehydrogenase, partial [Candidatus Calescamantes bacterium]|nr:UDP-glucose 6-dehydrogenase [Candidatus Calescamantes bacterium]
MSPVLRAGLLERLFWLARLIPDAIEHIAVGTPPDEQGHADLKYVREVAAAIADHMDGYTVVVTKSTVP